MDGVVQGLNLEDVLSNAIEVMNYEEYDGWCSSPCTSSGQMFPSVFAPLDGLNHVEQCVSGSPTGDCDIVGNWVLGGDKTTFPFSADGMVHEIKQRDNSSRKSNAMDIIENDVILRPPKESLDEKIFRALHLFKEWSGGGILAQVWVPMKDGDNFILSTREQPYLLDQTLSGYRQVSSLFKFAAEARPGSFQGLPGRVFMSKIPEWTSNVMYYSEAEYLRVQYAIDHRVRGLIALPVFEDNLTERSCCAVIELVTTEEKQNFDLEMQNVCRALQAVDLSSTMPPRLGPQSLSKNQKATLAEIADVLCVICHTHQLPLALTWIPCSYMEDARDETTRIHTRGKHIGPNEKLILCIEEMACYSNNTYLQGFVHACGEHFLEEGQGIVGKALQSNQPLFYHDVKEYDISEYPLVHHARKFGLNASVAIRLRTSYTGDDDYILEFFLPVNMKGSVEQQFLLNNLSNTMQKICRSLRKVSDEEMVRENDSKVVGKSMVIDDFNSVDRVSRNVYELKPMETKQNGPSEQKKVGLTRQMEKKRSTAEKHISLSVLQQYFSGSLKDAAKSLGVCPTTLKRICRQQGISRWPSRKINKVNRSLKKIQRVLESVEGVEGGLKFNPTSGELVGAATAASSIIQDFESGKSFFFTGINQSTKQLDSVIPTSVLAPSTSCISNATNEGLCLLDVRPLFVKSCDESRLAALDTGPSWPASLSTVPWTTSPKATSLSQSCIFSGCPSSINFSNEISNGSKGSTMINQNNGVTEHSQPTSSGKTDSSNSSGLMTSGSSSSSRSFGEKMPSKTEASCGDSGTKITVKATYRDDKVRFKFDPTAGCSELYAEVAMRFKLHTEQFQLKYLDDEEEWVRLATNSDLLECLDILELLGTRTVKFLVRDLPNVQVQRITSW